MKTYISLIIAALISLLSPTSFASTLSYTAADLGKANINPDDTIIITDMNNSGIITGYSTHGTGLVWNNGSVTVLNNFGGIFATSTATRAYSVNNSGQVVGSYSNPNQPGFNRSFLLQNGTATDMLTMGIGPSNGSIALSINNNSVVVGPASTNLGSNFYLEGGILSSLPHLAQDGRAQPNDINDNNITVGKSYGSGVISAVMWQNGAISSLGFTGSYSEPFAINNSNEIIGMSSEGGFLWKDGVVTNFPEYDMRDINNLGQIIAGNRIYQDGVFSDIEIITDNDLTGGGFSPQVINDLGQIAGIGNNGNVFLLTPVVPEPSETTLLMISLSVLIARRKK